MSQADSKPLVYVTLVNFEGWADTLACCKSLRESDYRNMRILVVDNASTNNSFEKLQSIAAEIELIRTDYNMGFAGGQNLATRRALDQGAEYVWILNNDTVVDPAALTAMVDAAEAQPTLGAMGAAIYERHEPDELQTWGGGRVSKWMASPKHFRTPVPDSELHYLTGASMLVRRAVWEQIGFFDETFFMYWEDTDFCMRLRNAGWQIGVTGDARIWHKVSSTVGAHSTRYDQMFNRSAMHFYRKHSPVPGIPMLFGPTLRTLRHLINGHWSRACATLRGAYGR